MLRSRRQMFMKLSRALAPNSPDQFNLACELTQPPMRQFWFPECLDSNERFPSAPSFCAHALCSPPPSLPRAVIVVVSSRPPYPFLSLGGRHRPEVDVNPRFDAPNPFSFVSLVLSAQFRRRVPFGLVDRKGKTLTNESLFARHRPFN